MAGNRRTALARLPEHLRQVVRLREQNKLSFEEIGRRMGRTALAVRHLWLCAVGDLGRELEDMGEAAGSVSDQSYPPTA